MSRFISNCLIGLLLLTFSSNVASAGLILDLQFQGGGTSKTVNIGQSFFVEMWISDTDGSTLLTEEGLLTAGGGLVKSAGAASVTKAGNTVVNSGFDTVDQNQATASPQIAAFFASTSDLGPATGIGAGLVGVANSFLLATFELQATGAIGDMATIDAALLGGAFEGFATYGHFDGGGDFVPGVILDGQIVSGQSLSLTTAVPEPASIFLGSLTAAMAGGTAWKRRRKISV